MRKSGIGIGKFLIVAGAGYSGTVLFIRGLQFLVKGLLNSQGESETHTQDDTDNTFGSWEYFADNVIDKRWKLREMLQDDTDHTFDSWEYFVDNYYDKPWKIREFLKDNTDDIFNYSEYFLDIFEDEPWKHEFLQEGTAFISDEEQTEDEVVTDEKMAGEW